MSIAGTWLVIIGSHMSGARSLLLKYFEPFFTKPQELGLVDPQVMRVDHGFIDRLGEELAAHVFLERRAGRPHEAAFADDRLDDALAFEFGVGLGNGIAV